MWYVYVVWSENVFGIEVGDLELWCFYIIMLVDGLGMKKGVKI